MPEHPYIDFADFGLTEGSKVGWEVDGVIFTGVITHIETDEVTGETRMTIA